MRMRNVTHGSYCWPVCVQVLWVGGLGNKTYFPPWITKYPQDTSIAAAKKEFDAIMVQACR
jgi:hypothetical protein